MTQEKFQELMSKQRVSVEEYEMIIAHDSSVDRRFDPIYTPVNQKPNGDFDAELIGYDNLEILFKSLGYDV